MKKSSETMKGGDGMSPRKAMAAGKGDGGGDFGVGSYAEQHGTPITHPDMKAGTGRKGVMDDGDRGIGSSIMHTKGQHPAQAAPDHGPTHPGSHGTMPYPS